MALERLKGVGEKINLRVEIPLWQAICNYHGSSEALKENPQILLIGTDSHLRLASEILKTHPEAQITVVERDRAVVEKASKRIPKGASLAIIHGEFPQVDLPEESYPLVIAKNLIHFLSEQELKKFVAGVGKVLLPKGLFFASTPPIIGGKPWYELQMLTIPFKEQNLPGVLGGTLFIFENLKP